MPIVRVRHALNERYGVVCHYAGRFAHVRWDDGTETDTYIDFLREA